MRLDTRRPSQIGPVGREQRGYQPTTEFNAMTQFSGFTSTPPKKVIFKSSNGTTYCDYKQSEDLRRFLTPNGKIQSRKKTGLNAREQRMVAQAIKRARYLGLLPYTSATL